MSSCEGGQIADINIYRIVGVRSSTQTPLIKLCGQGVENTAVRILQEHISRVTTLGVDSLKSYAPIRGGELRSSVVIEDQGELQNRILIPESGHSESGPLGNPGRDTRRRTPNIGRRGGVGVRISNALLAQILDDGVKLGSPPEHADVIRPELRVKYRQRPGRAPLQRSQGSDNVPPFGQQFGGTKDWISKAQRDFIGRLNNDA